MLPITSIRGKLPVAPVGDTGTVPFSMREHAEDFVNVAFDSSEGPGSGDGSQWWFVNHALGPRKVKTKTNLS